ncbi:MAG: di-heme oxidoredictase family protein [Archangium sp.]
MLRVQVSLLVLLSGCGAASPYEDAGTPGHDAGVGFDASVPGDLDIADASTPLPDAGAIAGALTLTGYGTLPFLSPAHVDQVLQTGYSFGREFFAGTWEPAPSTTRPNLDGLGPLFHAESCVACHPATGRPVAFAEDGTVDVGILFRLVGPDGADPIFGGQLQPRAIAGVKPEAVITWLRPSDRAPPIFQFRLEPTYGQFEPTTRALPRLSPHLEGMGLLEAVTDETLLALEDPDDANGDGISGRAARLPNDGGIGRFGWKAVQPTLATQAAAAFAGDMGITSPTHTDDCTTSQTVCRTRTNGGTPEAPQEDLDAVAFFMRYLGVPAQRRTAPDATLNRGHALFEYAGCGSCHRPSLRTSSTAPEGLRDVTFYAYTDLLLHDLGPALAETIGEGVAQPAEWRTPPLWGLGIVEKDEAARFMHDGRAADLREAIRWHGGEAQQARDRVERLSPRDEAALMEFVRSL